MHHRARQITDPIAMTLRAMSSMAWLVPPVGPPVPAFPPAPTFAGRHRDRQDHDAGKGAHQYPVKGGHRVHAEGRVILHRFRDDFAFANGFDHLVEDFLEHGVIGRSRVIFKPSRIGTPLVTSVPRVRVVRARMFFSMSPPKTGTLMMN